LQARAEGKGFVAGAVVGHHALLCFSIPRKSTINFGPAAPSSPRTGLSPGRSRPGFFLGNSCFFRLCRAVLTCGRCRYCQARRTDFSIDPRCVISTAETLSRLHHGPRPNKTPISRWTTIHFGNGRPSGVACRLVAGMSCLSKGADTSSDKGTHDLKRAAGDPKIARVRRPLCRRIRAPRPDWGLGCRAGPP
jgi:hypothetical protein